MFSIQNLVFSIMAVNGQKTANNVSTAGVGGDDTKTASSIAKQSVSFDEKRKPKPPGCVPKRPLGNAWNLQWNLVLWFAVTAVCGHTTAYNVGTVGVGGDTTTAPSDGQQTVMPGGKRVPKPPGCVSKRPPGYAWNPQGALGVWYGYMFMPSEMMVNLTNSVEHDRGIGWLLDSDEQTWVQSVHMTSREDVEPYRCKSAYLYKNISCNGFAKTNTYAGGIGMDGVGEYHDFVHIYMEPNFVYVRVHCYDPDVDTFTVDYCEKPGVSVWTRKKPIDVTPLEDLLIRDILDDRLASYCMTADDMQYMKYVDNLPPCPFVGQTENIRQERNYGQDYLVQKCFNPHTDGRCVPAAYY